MKNEDPKVFAKRIIEECEKVLTEAYENAGLSGICAEGRWDLALDALRALKSRYEAEKPKIDVQGDPK
jgi:hypothetical protein